MKPSDNFIKKQKEFLQQEKERLEKNINTLTKYPDYGDLEDDNIQELTDFENNMSIEDQLEFLLKKVKAALAAIENKTYGQCKKCKSSIDQGRLNIMPYADLCVSCQTNAKKK